MKVAVNTAALGDIVDLVMGQAPSSKDTNFEGRGTPFVKVGEFGEHRPVTREWTTNPLRMARKTDVLLCVVGATCGKINLGEECAIGRSVAAIRPHPSKLDQFYLYYFMMTLVERLRSGSVGAAQTVISKEMVQEVQIPFPPLSEQQRIVGLLDEAFGGLATAQAHAAQNLQNARDLFESHLNAVFTQRGEGWVETTLEDVCGFQNGFAFKSSTFKETGYPILRISNIQAGKIDSEKLVFFNPKDYRENLDRYRIVEGDLLIAMSGATTGKIGFNTEATVFYLNQRVGKFEPSPKLNKRFLFYYLSTKVDENLRISAGAAQPNLSTEQIKSFILPHPNRAEQDTNVTQLDALAAETQRLTRIYEQKLAALAALKKSLLHQAFSGEL